jgi:hypothetical protein
VREQRTMESVVQAAQHLDAAAGTMGLSFPRVDIILVIGKTLRWNHTFHIKIRFCTDVIWRGEVYETFNDLYTNGRVKSSQVRGSEKIESLTAPIEAIVLKKIEKLLGPVTELQPNSTDAYISSVSFY